jgi:hypothetical protein
MVGLQPCRTAKEASVMKTFLDMVGKQTPEEDAPLELRSDLMMRKMEPNESLTGKLLSAQASDAAEDRRGITDPLLRGLVDRLPKPNSTWPLDDRAKWLRTAAGIFDLVYKSSDGEHREISIVFVKQDAATE